FSTSLSTEPSTDQCVLYDLEGLRELYAELEVGHRVITYCNSGNRASVSYLVLRSLGFDVAVYDGGWLEWSDNPRLPIRSGLEP
ncbi:MAG: rhodanese-like domain-containing protein, partial [Myxococcota bacterium]